MSSGYMLGAYWSPRQEAIDVCVGQLIEFFQELAVCDPALSTWYERGRSAAEALTSPLDVKNKEKLLDLLKRGRTRRGVDHKVIEELGFRIGLWNGGSHSIEASLTVQCGLFWRPSDPEARSRLYNSVIINWPSELGELSKTENMIRVLSVVSRIWQPEWAGVMSHHSMNSRKFDVSTPFMDWMLYTPKQISSLGSPASVIQLLNLGSIIVTQPTPPLADDHEAVIRAKCIGDLITLDTINRPT